MNPLKQEASREEKCPPLCVCGCPRDRHEIEPPYPCYDCGCEIYTIGHKGSATAQTPQELLNVHYGHKSDCAFGRQNTGFCNCGRWFNRIDDTKGGT